VQRLLLPLPTYADLNIHVTAEGVELKANLQFLEDCACNRNTGIFLCHPITLMN